MSKDEARMEATKWIQEHKPWMALVRVDGAYAFYDHAEDRGDQ